MDLPSGGMPDSSDAVATEDSPPGQMRAAAEEPAVGDSPPGEMPVAEGEAEELEDLPSGKRSRTEAKKEDVEMQDHKEQQEEEIPQDDPMDAPNYGAEDLDDENQRQSQL